MSRPEGWELRLVAEIGAARYRVWSWGGHDCATFSARCLAAQFGFPPLLWTKIEGRWTTETGAARLLRAEGWASVAEALDSVTARLARPGLAGRGDLAAAETAEGAAVGIVEGGAAWFAADRGLSRLELSSCFAAWPAEGLY